MCVRHAEVFPIWRFRVSSKLASPKQRHCIGCWLAWCCAMLCVNKVLRDTNNRVFSLPFLPLQIIPTIDFLLLCVFILISSFTPVYLFLIFFHATWLVRMQTGPIWPSFADTERSVCRRNWWANVLYINNIFTANEPVNSNAPPSPPPNCWKFYELTHGFCLVCSTHWFFQCIQHAWYLAADFQLVIVGTLIQMILWRFPKYTKTILGSCVMLSFIIPSVVTYVNKFDGIFMATLE